MADDASSPIVKSITPKGGLFTRSLSARLLGLTIIFVLVSEVLIFAPSLGMFHRMWLQERVNAAQIAALALEAAPEAGVTESLRKKLLENAEVSRVALKRDGTRELRLDAPLSQPDATIHTIDLRQRSTMGSTYAAINTMLAPPGRELRVLATPRFEAGEFIEIVIAEAPLKRDIAAYAVRALRMSLILSLVTGLLVYLTLNGAFVRPMRKLTAQIEKFREHPEDVSHAIAPSGRADEIGRAERALADMETDVRTALRQRERLAGLGAAVAKLAHDLRNSLATASLVTEHLADSDDPRVRQSAPRLVRAIARAGNLAAAALRYGRAEEPAPHLAPVRLFEALNEAADDALAAYTTIEWRNGAPVDMAVTADAEHLHRIFANLMRNAAEAVAPRPGRIEARVARTGNGMVVIELADNGPGLAPAAQARLFEPFSSTTHPGGAGLGLSIARELARSLGGDLDLVSSGAEGAVFAITLRTEAALAPVRP